MTPEQHLSKDDIRTLPPYPGLAPTAVSVVTNEVEMEAAYHQLSVCRVLGFDTESRPTFHKGEVSSGPHLVQLATRDHAYLFPVERLTDLARLRAILESPAIRKVGFELGSDVQRLRTKLGIECAALVDIGRLFRQPGEHRTVGAVQAVARLFGQAFRKSKRQSTSNWASPVLSEPQRVYAGNDAYVALQVYHELERQGRVR
jgi:RNA polymerase sigma factor for flagellar operon FliA